MSSTYLSQEQMRHLPEEGLIICANAEEAFRFVDMDGDLEAIRFLRKGSLIYAVVLRLALAKATGRTK